MPVLILFGLITLTMLLRRQGHGRALPGPLLALAVLVIVALIAAQPWVLQAATFAALIWAIATLSRHEHLARWPQRRQEAQRWRRVRRGYRSWQPRDPHRTERDLIPVPATLQNATFPPVARPVTRANAVDDCSRAIERLLQQHGRRLPQEAVASIRELQVKVRDTMGALEARGLSDGETAFTVRQAAHDYLPGAVRAYLRLPARQADSAPLSGGKTGKVLLLEQIAMLHRAVDEAMTALTLAEASDLLTHQRFLKDRLGQGRRDFRVE